MYLGHVQPRSRLERSETFEQYTRSARSSGRSKRPVLLPFEYLIAFPSWRIALPLLAKGNETNLVWRLPDQSQLISHKTMQMINIWTVYYQILGTSNEVKWRQMLSNDVTWGQMRSNDAKWGQMTSNGRQINKWRQMTSNKEAVWESPQCNLETARIRKSSFSRREERTMTPDDPVDRLDPDEAIDAWLIASWITHSCIIPHRSGTVGYGDPDLNNRCMELNPLVVLAPRVIGMLLPNDPDEDASIKQVDHLRKQWRVKISQKRRKLRREYAIIKHLAQHYWIYSRLMSRLMSHVSTHVSCLDSCLMSRLTSHVSIHVSCFDSRLMSRHMSHVSTHVSCLDSRLMSRLTSHVSTHVSCLD